MTCLSVSAAKRQRLYELGRVLSHRDRHFATGLLQQANITSTALYAAMPPDTPKPTLNVAIAENDSTTTSFTYLC